MGLRKIKPITVRIDEHAMLAAEQAYKNVWGSGESALRAAIEAYLRYDIRRRREAARARYAELGPL